MNTISAPKEILLSELLKEIKEEVVIQRIPPLNLVMLKDKILAKTNPKNSVIITIVNNKIETISELGINDKAICKHYVLETEIIDDLEEVDGNA